MFGFGGCSSMMGGNDMNCAARCETDERFGCGKCKNMREVVGMLTGLESCMNKCEGQSCSEKDRGYHLNPHTGNPADCEACREHCGDDEHCHMQCDGICGMVHRQHARSETDHPLPMHDMSSNYTDVSFAPDYHHEDHWQSDMHHDDHMGHSDMGHSPHDDMGHSDMGHSDMGYSPHHDDMGHSDMGHSDMGHSDMGHSPHDDMGHSDMGQSPPQDMGHTDMGHS